MKKGIIMEVNERFLTMLTPEGEFLRAKKEDRYYEVGQEIYFSPLAKAQKKKLWSFSFESFKGRSFAAMAMAVALIIAIVSFSPFSNHNQVYAYMSIDVNPSIELGVNERLQVVELTAYNESGKKVINEINDWEQKQLKEVTQQIVSVIKENGYFANQKDVVIGMVHTGEIIEKSEEKLDQSIKVIEENMQDEVILTEVQATTKERKIAQEKGITVGQLVKEQTEKNRNKEIESEPKEAPQQQENIQKGQEELNDQKDENKKNEKMPPGQVKKAEEQNKEQRSNANDHKEKKQENKVPPGKNKEEKQNNKNRPSEKNQNKDNKQNNEQKEQNNSSKNREEKKNN